MLLRELKMTEPEKTESGSRTTDARSGTLIFISHDTRDAELAEAFSKLLNGVSAGVLKSFRSSDRKGSQGIEYGVEWYPQLMKKLNDASDVVCLLTQRSLERPWILFEAGVARGKLDTPVYGIALGIPLNRANSGPFAQFQNCADGEDELTKLVTQLVGRIPGAEPDPEALRMQVRTFKQRADTALKHMKETPEPANEEHPEASVAKLFEEVKVMFQDLPLRIERRVVEPSRYRRWRRFHPMMIEELASVCGISPDDPVGILVIASLVRDDLPWLYELAMEVYRASKMGDSGASEYAEHTERLRKAIDITFRGPFLEDLGMSKELHMVLREMLPRMLSRVQGGQYLPPKTVKAEPRRIEGLKPPPKPPKADPVNEGDLPKAPDSEKGA